MGGGLRIKFQLHDNKGINKKLYLRQCVSNHMLVEKRGKINVLKFLTVVSCVDKHGRPSSDCFEEASDCYFDKL